MSGVGDFEADGSLASEGTLSGINLWITRFDFDFILQLKKNMDLITSEH